MPVKKRAAKPRNPTELLPIEMAFLRDEPEPDDPEDEFYGHWWSLIRDDDMFRPDRPSVADLWAAVGDEIVAEWAREHPGSRPSCWWRHDAPENLRRRVGGRGEPGDTRQELPDAWPQTRCGVPISWHWPRPTRPGEWVAGEQRLDLNDLPTFESQPAYLRRHDLLLPGEAERLTDADFEPTPIRVPEHVRCQ